MPKGKTILIVDDDPVLVRGHARMLKDYWDIVTAGSVPEAIEIIAEGAIDAVLSDWNMPAGGGAAVIEAARAKNIPVVILSAAVGLDRDLAHLASNVIQKPSPREVIDGALWNALERGQNPAKIQ